MNPANERLRNEITKPPDVTTILEDILLKTNKIHVAFLFTGIGKKLLQKLARCLCATKDSLIYSGWKELSIKLGLDPLLPKCLENCNILNQDPVSTMLVPYTQIHEATMSKIFQGLYDIERHDVIFQTQVYVYEFYEEINKLYDLTNQTKIVKPTQILLPSIPIIFQNLEGVNNENKTKQGQNELDTTDCEIKPLKENKINYGKIVMLTYRSQDSIIAQKIANEFRKERNGQRIGVILLQEHAEKVYADREKLILKFFARADYIIPVLTKDYLSCISEKEICSSAIDNVDSAYVKYIYNLMTSDYMSDGCQNKRIRCVIPDEQFLKIQKHYAFKNPIFRTWIALSEVDDLVNKVLLNKI